MVAIEPPDNYPPVATVAPGASTQARLHARYLSAVHYVDALVGQVLDDLERRKLLEPTVVFVTSDHGAEFDENGQGFTGHGTSYSDYQLQTPLVLRWPGRPPGRVGRRTSHNDVAPTLVGGLFGCTNEPSDYASGRDLFSDGQWGWLHRGEPQRVRLDRARAGHDRVPGRATRSATGTIGWWRTRRSRATACEPPMQEMSRFYR